MDLVSKAQVFFPLVGMCLAAVVAAEVFEKQIKKITYLALYLYAIAAGLAAIIVPWKFM